MNTYKGLFIATKGEGKDVDIVKMMNGLFDASIRAGYSCIELINDPNESFLTASHNGDIHSVIAMDSGYREEVELKILTRSQISTINKEPIEVGSFTVDCDGKDVVVSTTKYCNDGKITSIKCTFEGNRAA